MHYLGCCLSKEIHLEESKERDEANILRSLIINCTNKFLIQKLLTKEAEIVDL